MNKLEYLHKMRERCGVVFRKSFRCEDAEKNMHLLDIDTFFEKFKKKLRLMGYVPSDDFEFNIIRTKYNYAERHHVGRTYNWKYFYSSTFTISEELIEYLLRHNFIFHENSMIVKSKSKIKKVKEKENLHLNHVLSLLAAGRTKKEIVGEFRKLYENLQRLVEEKSEVLKNKADSDEKLQLEKEIKDLKAESRWYKHCIFELRLLNNDNLKSIISNAPYNKLIIPIEAGKSLNETKEYLQDKIIVTRNKIEEIILKLADRNIRKNKERLKGYNHEKDEKKKNLKAFTVCLMDLQLGEFDSIFND